MTVEEALAAVGEEGADALDLAAACGPTWVVQVVDGLIARTLEGYATPGGTWRYRACRPGGMSE